MQFPQDSSCLSRKAIVIKAVINYMNRLQLLTICSLIGFCSFGQNESVSTWIKVHPHVHIFSQEDFDQLSEDKQQRIANSTIVIQSTELSWSDIVAFEWKQVHKGTAYSIDPEHAEEIKFWIAEHPNTKVLTREYFDQLSTERKQQYLQYELLIVGENTLTLSDIERYETNH